MLTSFDGRQTGRTFLNDVDDKGVQQLGETSATIIHFLAHGGVHDPAYFPV
jgi:hypothetical protein